MFNKQDKNKARQKRHLRVRNHISGTAERPRLNVFRSLSNIYAQVIDDVNGVTLVSVRSKIPFKVARSVTLNIRDESDVSTKFSE